MGRTELILFSLCTYKNGKGGPKCCRAIGRDKPRPALTLSLSLSSSVPARTAMIHLDAGHPIVAETVSARVHADAGKYASVDVSCSDFGAKYYIHASPDEKSVLRVSLLLGCFEEVRAQVGDEWFTSRYAHLWQSPPHPGYSVTLRIDLSALPAERAAREAIVRQCATLKRDVTGAPLWICFGALGGAPVPNIRPHYCIRARPDEATHVIPRTDDCVLVCFMIAFEHPTEAALARVFIQEAEITRRQNRDLAAAPSVAFTQEYTLPFTRSPFSHSRASPCSRLFVTRRILDFFFCAS